MLAAMTDRIESTTQELDPGRVWREQEGCDTVIAVADCLIRRLVGHFGNERMLGAVCFVLSMNKLMRI